MSNDNVDGSARDTVPPREHRQTGLALSAQTESPLSLLQRDCLATAEKGELHLLRIGIQVVHIVVSLRSYLFLSLLLNPIPGIFIFCQLGFML